MTPTRKAQTVIGERPTLANRPSAARRPSTSLRLARHFQPTYSLTRQRDGGRTHEGRSFGKMKLRPSDDSPAVISPTSRK